MNQIRQLMMMKSLKMGPALLPDLEALLPCFKTFIIPVLLHVVYVNQISTHQTWSQAVFQDKLHCDWEELGVNGGQAAHFFPQDHLGG